MNLYQIRDRIAESGNPVVTNRRGPIKARLIAVTQKVPLKKWVAGNLAGDLASFRRKLGHK